MAVRRGVGIVLGLIIAAIAVSAMGLVPWPPLSAASRRSAGNSTLVLRIGGDLQEMEPGGVIGQFFEAPPTVRSLVEALRKAKVDRRISSVIIRPTGAGGAVGQGAGGPRRDPRLPPLGQADRRLSRVRRRAGVLPAPAPATRSS